MEGHQSERSAAHRLRVRGEAHASEGRLNLDEELLEPQAAAAWLGLESTGALRRLIDEEGLPHIRIDHPLLIPRSDLELWAEQRTARLVVDAGLRARKAAILRRFVATAACGREELVAWCNAAVRPPSRRGLGRGRPRIRAVSPNTVKPVVIHVMTEAVREDLAPLVELCREMEAAGLRRRLSEEGNGRALELLGQLEEGLDVEREGPDALAAAESLELPGLWSELDDWVEALLAELVSGESSASMRLRAELTGVIGLFREGVTASPMVLLRRMTLFQLRSLAAHLALPARRSKVALLEMVAEDLRERFGE